MPIKIAPVMLKEQNLDRMFFLSNRCLGKNRDMAKSIEYLMWLQQGHRIRAFTGQFNINASSKQFQQPVLLEVQLDLISFITLGLGCYKGVTHIWCPHWGGKVSKNFNICEWPWPLPLQLTKLGLLCPCFISASLLNIQIYWVSPFTRKSALMLTSIKLLDRKSLNQMRNRSCMVPQQ